MLPPGEDVSGTAAQMILMLALLSACGPGTADADEEGVSVADGDCDDTDAKIHPGARWSDGTSALVFSPAELVERLVALVPPPWANQVIYRGVLSANAAWRAEVLPRPPPETPEAAKARRAKRLTRHPRMRLAGDNRRACRRGTGGGAVCEA